MGAYLIAATFSSALPDPRDVRKELVRLRGSERAIESVDVEDGFLLVTTPFDQVAVGYALKVVQDLGGTAVWYPTQDPIEYSLPTFVERPWKSWSIWRRTSFRWGLGRNPILVARHRKSEPKP